MCERAAHLVNGVFGDLPVRQWVLTLPHRLRYALAYDHRLCRAVLGIFVRAVLSAERRRAGVHRVRGRGGAVTAIQRCGAALNVNVHFHTLGAQGAFEEQADGSRRFVPAAPPTDAEVAHLLAAVRRRIIRLVRRHGIDLEGGVDDEHAADPLLLDSAALAQIQGASVLGRVATGPRAGQRVLRLGHDPAAPVVTSGGPRHAHLQGFDLHANVAVPAGEREQLENLCRYVLRPPVAQHALELTTEGQVLLRLRRTWRDGTRAIRFEPSELLEKLAAMIPRPRANLLIYHGAFAPRGCCRGAKAGETGEAAASDPIGEPPPAGGGSGDQAARIDPGGGAPAAAIARPPPGYVRPRHYAWADLLRHTFSTDILACPDCGGRLRLLATIAERAAIEKILKHLGLPADLPSPAPPRAPPWLPGLPDDCSADREWPD